MTLYVQFFVKNNLNKVDYHYIENFSLLDNYKYVIYFVFYSRKIISRVNYRNF